jgi:hypothetical protein
MRVRWFIAGSLERALMADAGDACTRRKVAPPC